MQETMKRDRTNASASHHPGPATGLPGIRALMGLVLFWCFGSGLHAQTKPFSSDQALFLQEVTDFLVNADKKEGKPFMEQVFTPAWTGTWYSERQRVKVVEVALFR